MNKKPILKNFSFVLDFVKFESKMYQLCLILVKNCSNLEKMFYLIIINFTVLYQKFDKKGYEWILKK